MLPAMLATDVNPNAPATTATTNRSAAQGNMRNSPQLFELRLVESPCFRFRSEVQTNRNESCFVRSRIQDGAIIFYIASNPCMLWIPLCRRPPHAKIPVQPPPNFDTPPLTCYSRQLIEHSSSYPERWRDRPYETSATWLSAVNWQTAVPTPADCSGR